MHAHALFLLIAVATLVLQGSILKDGYLEDVGDQYVFFRHSMTNKEQEFGRPLVKNGSE